MKIDKGFIEFNNGILINWWQEYVQFFNIKTFNWSEFHLIDVSFEYDRMCGGLEFMFVILGLALRLRIPIKTDKSEKTWKNIKESTDKLRLSFSGYAKQLDIDKFKKRQVDSIRLYRKKEDCPKTITKLFIQ